jgi:hypothetical protein
MIGFESTFGTAPSTGYVLPVNYGEGVKGSQAINEVNTIRGNRNPRQPFRGYRDVSGPVPVPLDSVCFPYWLCAMFGDPTSDGSGPYTHQWSVANAQPSFTYEKAFTDLTMARYARHLGCKVDTLSIDAGGDGELAANLGIFGAEESWQTSAFDAAATSPALARVNHFDGAVEEGGATSSVITRVSLNIGFGLDKRPEIIPIANAGVRSDLPAGAISVGGSVTTLFNDDGYTLMGKGIDGTQSSLKVTFTASASSIVEFELQEIEYARNGVEIPTPEGLLVGLDFKGFYEDGSDASAVVFRVTNSVASYDVVP